MNTQQTSHPLLRNLRLACAAAGAFALLSGCAQNTGNSDAVAALQAQVQRAQDIQEINNLMSRRAFYHSAGRNDLEFELFAKNVADISWGQNQGFWVGHDAIKAYYVTANTANRKKETERLAKLYPQINVDDPALQGAGIYVMHALTTPIIEVAKDGNTAKGVWYTPGALANANAKGNLDAAWLWERYAVDFIKEDGQWKFWHILVLSDFMAGFTQGLPAESGVAQQAPTGAESAQGSANPNAPTVAVENYKFWSATHAQPIAPQLPEPYNTFSETFSYGPPAT